MIAETLSVGTELLLGQITDTNAVYLAKTLSSIGIGIYYRTTVGDNETRLRQTLKTALERSDVIITIGGLGPTMDDITKEVVCDTMGATLVEEPDVRAKLEALMVSRGIAPTNSFYKQALVPAAADGQPVPNPNGTAPGVIVEKNGKIAICLPGPPNEFIPMVEQTVVPFLSSRNSGQTAVIKSKTLRIIGIGESRVEEMVHDLLLSDNPTVAPYAKLGECHLRITARAETGEKADALIAPREAALRARLGDAVYGVDDEALEHSVVELLKKHKLTIATAESCTGGLLARRITSIAGASNVFRTGIVSYSNDAKQSLLDVQADTLKKFGAVAAETAREMATGVRELDAADIGVAVTGIAGPDGGTPEKPVGLVYICVVSGDDEPRVERFLYPGSRTDITQRASQNALALVRNIVLKAAIR
ncbi:MAG: competence/damage-inducible protein A [Capsulimonadaceae bacterium]|nr:competence/damage-inducible protein A [Capsulimonadaceae bacterium]